jgi:pimeloyl-ACP methyl ester carboxylesterase
MVVTFMPVVKTGDIKLNYLQLPCESESDGPVQDLVMIHGLATNMAFWYMNVAQAFASHFRVTLYDLRGHGRSSMPESGYTPEDHARDLDVLLEHLDIRNPHVVAHSFGAVVALQYAILNPGKVASLVLADSHIAEVRHMQHRPQWRYAEVIQQVVDQNGLELSADDPYFGYRLLKQLAKKQLAEEVMSDDLKDIINPLMSKAGKRTADQWVRLLDTTSAEQELMGDDGLSLEKLTTFRFPILALYGERSQALTTGEKLLWVWPHARFCVFRNEGHFFPVTNSAKVIEECLTFWARQRVAPIRQRNNDAQRRNYFRSNRFEREGDDWFFSTREGPRQGPFKGLLDAEAGLARYVSGVAS